MDKRRQRTEWLVLAGCCALSAALCRPVLRLRPEDRPQVPSDSVLTLVLGDARQQLSEVLYDKVEEYFHGGVRCVVCDHGLVSGEAEPHGHAHAREEKVLADRQAAPHETGDHGHEEGPQEQVGASWDPWAWLDGQVHVQAHRHLEGDSAVELLPWVWASCRASPKNVQAYIGGSYVLSRMVGRSREAARLLEEGIRNNPRCGELDFALGELMVNHIKDFAAAEVSFLSALRKCSAPEVAEDEEARTLRLHALFYLGYLAKRNGDAGRLREYMREADAIDPLHISARNLHALLKAYESKE